MDLDNILSDCILKLQVWWLKYREQFLEYLFDHIVEHRKREKKTLLQFSFKDPPDSTLWSCYALYWDFMNTILFPTKNVQTKN